MENTKINEDNVNIIKIDETDIDYSQILFFQLRTCTWALNAGSYENVSSSVRTLEALMAGAEDDTYLKEKKKLTES